MAGPAASLAGSIRRQVRRAGTTVAVMPRDGHSPPRTIAPAAIRSADPCVFDTMMD
ncbi:hypothetical protein [Sphingomonas montana]|uniref:hypothetical protein n=1 Tax=Sphingomonas montana TaxID=1843236 RepID=UPI0013EBADC3|nr:hypothetical protein [Sphingomonas montana]